MQKSAKERFRIKIANNQVLNNQVWELEKKKREKNESLGDCASQIHLFIDSGASFFRGGGGWQGPSETPSETRLETLMFPFFEPGPVLTLSALRDRHAACPSDECNW